MPKSKKQDKHPNIEILVVNHKPSYVPQNELLKPIQVGAALASKQLDGMAYYDNVGDSISERNRSYCELTAIYWAWKNLDLDYYGLFHYRRYLSFKDNEKHVDAQTVAYPDVPSSLSSIGLDETAVRKLISQYDLVIPRMGSVIDTTGHASIYEQYKSEHNIADLDYCLDYVKQHYPDIAPFTDVLHQSEGYFCNMFIMNKELFNEYCSFIFDVLESFEKNNDISLYNPHQYRVTGFIAERLTNIFIQYVQARGGLKVKELQVAYYENTNPVQTIDPIAKDNNVAIVLASDDYYIPYISTLLHSVVENSSDKYTYDVNIFNRNISIENQKYLIDEFEDYKNFSIRFYDLSHRYEEYKSLFTRGHFALETYFRLFIQDIMVGYDKVLYLDGDMIVRDDVSKIFKTDITKHLLAACLDPDTAGLYNGFEPQKKEYMDSVLKIERPYEYFQAGVILFNLNMMRKTLKVSDLIEFASSYEWELLDQDVLNYIAQGKVKFLDMSWNVMYDWRRIRLSTIVSRAPIELYEAYVEARQNPRIVHYAGPEKPWQDSDCDYAPYFWKHARSSVFYEQILARMGDWRTIHRSPRPGYLEPPRKGIKQKAKTIANKVAPKGTLRRKPIAYTYKLAKAAKNKLR